MNRVMVAGSAAALFLAACSTGEIGGQGRFATITASDEYRVDEPVAPVRLSLAKLLRTRLANDGVVPGAVASNPDREVAELIAGVRYAQHLAAARNDVVTELMISSTHNCGLYIQTLLNKRLKARVRLELSQVGGAMAAVAASGSKRTSGIVGARSRAEGFIDEVVELVAEGMRQRRAESSRRIHDKMSKGYDEWPMSEAIADLFQFENDCSATSGLAEMHGALLARERPTAGEEPEGIPLNRP